MESFLSLSAAARLAFRTLNILYGGSFTGSTIAVPLIGMVPIIRPLRSVLSGPPCFLRILTC